jgi:3,4-dihydroxy 2-butanone 4-phosphate synthase/GTP cyclohydrolase II
MALSTIEEAIAQLRSGGMVVVVDDEDRENEGDLIMAAEDVTPESMAFFLEYTSGVFCVPLEAERADALDFPLMVVANTEAQRTAFTVTVDYRHGTTTGISATDRAATVRAHRSRDASHDLNRPGHIFPLRYRAGGVLKRAGHTEATVDLCRLAGKFPRRRAL